MANAPSTVGIQQDNLTAQSCSQNEFAYVEQFVANFRKRAHEEPEKMALTCLAVGFFLGWKLKPW